MSIGTYIIPMLFVIIIFSCFKSKVNLYDAVITGAEDGLGMIKTILPTMIIILTAVSMLRASGILGSLTVFFKPLFQKIGVSSEILPMVMLRPISGSGSFGLLTDYYTNFGVDSQIGRLVSVIMGSTETTFYTIAVYYSGTGVKDVRRVLPCALLGDLVGIVVACLVVK